MEVVEHVADLPGFFQASCRLVGPGGILFGADADARRAEIQAQLAWSEGYPSS